MSVSRWFLLAGIVYILVGLGMGAYMGATGDRSLVPVHAHINLLGFVLPVLFALVYRSYPAMAVGRLPQVHFWLHEVGVLILMVMLFMLLTGRISEASMAPLAPISEALIILGTALFGWLVVSKAR